MAWNNNGGGGPWGGGGGGGGSGGGGGPWGGVAHRSREVFNPPHVFSPYGYVETCSTFSWIQLNRELLAITGDARYADEIEKSAYNDLLGAQAPEGDNWCY